MHTSGGRVAVIVVVCLILLPSCEREQATRPTVDVCDVLTPADVEVALGLPVEAFESDANDTPEQALEQELLNTPPDVPAPGSEAEDPSDCEYRYWVTSDNPPMAQYAWIWIRNLRRMPEEQFTSAAEGALTDLGFTTQHVGWLGEAAIVGSRERYVKKGEVLLFVMGGDASFAMDLRWYNTTPGTKGSPSLALTDLADLMLQRVADSAATALPPAERSMIPVPPPRDQPSR